MKKEMLINVLQPEECRIAIIENGVLEELYVERTSHESYTGNIYKGKIVNLEPAIQAAFVDFSVGRNGFLHVSDVEPQYYDRHAAVDDESDAGPSPAAGPGARQREPRRENRDRDRPERRPKADPHQADFGPPQLPPRGDDRGRDRDRDRERPDLSIKGQRDRSESPRRFGEGLVDDRENSGSPQPPSLPAPPPRAADLNEAELRPAGGAEEAPTSWSDPVDFGWGTDRDRGRDRDRNREPERPRDRDREFGPAEPAGSSWSQSRPEAEPFDPDLPPSRTQGRKRPEPSSDPDFELDERGRPRSLFGAPEPTSERGEPESFEAESPARGGREPRRGRGRGRSTPPPAPAQDEFEPEVVEPVADLVDEGPSEPPRRGGRAAIRSRGGDRPAPERPREPQPVERPAPRSAPIEPAARRPESFDRPTEPDADRTRPHNRAGEPGYVPRRERQRGVEPEFGAMPGPRSNQEPDDRRFDPLAELDPRDLAEADDEGESEAGAAQGKAEGRRRRRRRGRKRDRPEVESTTGPELEPELFDAEFDEPNGFREPAPAYGRRSDDLHDDEIDVDDLEEVDADEDDLFHDSARSAVEEEIDPELEQEIRNEIKEIEELEREMGLRGPVEARPRRGDPAGKFGRGRGLVKPPLQEIFRRGDEVLVQVIKESIGTKGPTLSTYISIPGRYLVLMPGLNRVGVSRKIVDEGQRRKLREIMHELNPPKGLGFIVRTAGLERTKRELARDLAYLLRLWKVILRRIKKARTPAPIYQESDLITRTIRDIFTSEIDTIWIDEPAAFERAQEFLRVVMPRFVNRIRLYDEKVPLFHKYGIEDEIAKIQRRHVPLPEGGSIVIDQTEALVAIDVNSGNFRVEDDAERTAYEMNLRAAKEIARQLRLRDLGGVIVNDFIDMREERHRRGVERALREAIKRDRARTKVLRMSAFGLIEMTRQRIRPSLKRSVYEDCSHCAGAGVSKTAESMAIDVMRLLALASHREEIRRVVVTVGPQVAMYLANRKRTQIARIETETGMSIQIQFKDQVAAEHLLIECFDANGGEVRLIPAPPPGHRRGH